MYRILLKATKTEELLPPCSSKLLGVPDVWDGFKWPEATNGFNGIGDDEYRLDFLCQINCAEIAEHDKDDLLPKTGILYFFFDWQNGTRQDNTVVFYYAGDLSELEPYLPGDFMRQAIDSGLDDMGVTFPESAIEFAFDEYKGGNERGDPVWVSGVNFPHYLLGKPNEPEQMGLGTGGDLPDSQQLLLVLNEVVFGPLEICYLIERTDLARKDFGKAWVVKVYD